MPNLTQPPQLAKSNSIHSCGSSSGNSPIHLEAARSLAHTFHAHNIKLVYGGGTVGVMGELARTLVSLSGPEAVHGVIPRALLRYERNYVENGAGGEIDPQSVIDEKTYGRTTVVEDMHRRKHIMASEVISGGPGSGFVALTGGYGTLEELMENVTWNQLGIHARAIVLYNVAGFWDGLLQWVGKAVDEGFIQPGNEGIMAEAKTSEEVVDMLRHYRVAEGRFQLRWGEK